MYSYTWSLSTDSGICPKYPFSKLGIVGVGAGCSSVTKHTEHVQGSGFGLQHCNSHRKTGYHAETWNYCEGLSK